MPRVFEYDNHDCMLNEKKCHGRCDLRVCPVRTPENAWRSHNSIYGIMGSKENYNKTVKLSKVNK